MKKTLLFVKKELLEMVPPTIFFFVMFSIILLIRTIQAEEYDIAVSSIAAIAILALIFGKSILIIDALPLFHWFRKKRLIHNVIWRSCLYLMIVLAFQYLEELIPLLPKFDTIALASEHLMEEVKWPNFWTSHIIMVVLLVFYILATELIRVIGRKEFIEIMFSSKHDHSTKVD